MWIYSNNPYQVIWLAENWKWAWHLNLFSMTRVNSPTRILGPRQDKLCCRAHAKYWFDLELYGPVNTVKVMLSRSFNIFTLFLGRLNPLYQHFVHILSPVTDNNPSRLSRWRIAVKIMDLLSDVESPTYAIIRWFVLICESQCLMGHHALWSKRTYCIHYENKPIQIYWKFYH